MTQVVIVGDSRVGKTSFAHIACNHELPLNIFRSTEVETFYLHGTETIATISVVPGTALDDILGCVCNGSDAIIVLYDSSKSIYTAKRWLARIERIISGVYQIPVMICSHSLRTSPCVHDRRISSVLMQYRNAEHACTATRRPAGIVDCVNRIVTKVRSQHPSPLERRCG
jgi:GTPase SAR1 family protein